MKQYEHIVNKLSGGLPRKDADRIENFFTVLDGRIDLPMVRKNELIEHFYRAFEYYTDHGYSVERIVNLMDPDNLGDFYRHNERQYISLDNAAIVYPLGMKFGQMPLFRLSANLRDEIVPEILQLALDFTMKRFPSFSAVIKSGIFWHYLETTNNIHQVEPENDIPCKPISIILRSFKSFRVLYYKKRISIEYFHAITDGSGGMTFLKTLLAEYFRLLGKRIGYGTDVLDINEEVDPAELVNEFNNTTAAKDLNTFLDKSSLQLDGKLTRVNINRIIHFELNGEEVLKRAHKYSGTVTAYMLAILFIASNRCMSRKDGVINIQVPVNMRKFNGSKTLRNYSMYFSASMKPEEIGDLKSMVKEMRRQIVEKGDESLMNQMMATTGNLIKMIDRVPMIMKTPVIQLAYGYLGNRIIAMTLSNLGNIEVPERMKNLIESFDFIIAPTRPNRAACALVSYDGKMRLTVSKATKDDSFENEIYDLLKEEGLSITVEGSEEYES
ncbi:MAG: hypothetical protein J5796_01420 [Erysipelotrichaceae bacterium]|nr:hypothetical protein [Erysipelotrichaceae bacterium]